MDGGGRNHFKLKLGLVIGLHANSNNALHAVKMKSFPCTCSANCLMFSSYRLKAAQTNSWSLHKDIHILLEMSCLSKGSFHLWKDECVFKMGNAEEKW